MLKLSNSKIFSLGLIALLAGACGQPGASNPGSPSSGPINGTWRAKTVNSLQVGALDASAAQISLSIQNGSGTLSQTSSGCTNTVPLSFTFNGSQVSVRQSSNSTKTNPTCGEITPLLDVAITTIKWATSFTNSGSILRFQTPAESTHITFTK